MSAKLWQTRPECHTNGGTISKHIIHIYTIEREGEWQVRPHVKDVKGRGCGETGKLKFREGEIKKSDLIFSQISGLNRGSSAL